ncbi:MAG: hypothetical protein LRZ84_05105 [Desertifilum sp.]|nr:hypothetical protein [Desertifilum sp.]
MFILKRQDVEISSVQHPKRDQQIPILNYQGQTFRLINVFSAAQADEAKAYWRDLTDNRGKACVLLEEPDRYSVWGKVRLDQLANEEAGTTEAKPALYTQACLLLLQAVYIDIEDLLGNRQASAFEKDLAGALAQWSFPQAGSAKAIKDMLTLDPLDGLPIQPWQEHHLINFLQELHRLGKDYFGNDSFTARAIEVLDDLSDGDRVEFTAWINKSPLGQLWNAG